MQVREAEPLASHTTFRIGGPAAVFVEVAHEEELKAAFALARERGLSLRVIGAGSNLLVPDEGIDALVVRVRIPGIAFVPHGAAVLSIAGAGEPWDRVVDAAAARGTFGIENLAGIPGTVGGAVVQNIGAYGAALSEVFAYADALDQETGETRRFTREECAFGYRESIFKHERRYVILRVALMLSSAGPGALSYRDLAEAFTAGSAPAPDEIAAAVRRIRAGKFPDLSKEGTAGSFFGNPMLPDAEAAALVLRFPGLPLFSVPEVATKKVPLGWILDHVLGLRGYARGGARVYEKHALVIAARPGTPARDVDALAEDIAARVHDATGITLAREVETFTV